MGRCRHNNRAFLSNTHQPDQQWRRRSICWRAASPKPTCRRSASRLRMTASIRRCPEDQCGQFSYHVPLSNLIPSYGTNQKAAKEFLRWFHSKEVYDTWFTSQQGFSVGHNQRCGKAMTFPAGKADLVMALFLHSGGKAAASLVTARPGWTRGGGKRSVSLSSSICTQRRCKARPPKKQSNGRTPNC